MNQPLPGEGMRALLLTLSLVLVAGSSAAGPLHHYVFEVDVQPGAGAFATRAEVFRAMQGHVLGKAVYGGRFRRPQ
jgi:hypothetical protein